MLHMKGNYCKRYILFVQFSSGCFFILLACGNNQRMSALKKFLPGKKKSKKSTSSSIKSSASEQNIGDIGNIPGYRNVKEKDLPKLHKAAWLGDTSKLKQLVKKGDVNSMDRHHRFVFRFYHVLI